MTKILTKNLTQILTKHLTKILTKPLAKSGQKLAIPGQEKHQGGLSKIRFFLNPPLPLTPPDPIPEMISEEATEKATENQVGKSMPGWAASGWRRVGISNLSNLAT